MPKSPTEAGELTPSPRADDDRQEIDDSLDIKPPQTHVKKEKSHKHKHKHKEHKREKSRERASGNINDREERRKRDRPHREDRPIRDDRPVRDQRMYDDRHGRDSRLSDRGRPGSSRDLGYPRTDSRGDLRSLEKPRDLRENIDRARMPRDERVREDRRYSPNMPRDDRKQPSPYERDAARRRVERRDDSRRRSRSPVDRKRGSDQIDRRRMDRLDANKDNEQQADGSSDNSKSKADKIREVVEVEEVISSGEEESGEEEDGEEEGEEESEEEESGEEEESSSGEEESDKNESGSEEEEEEEEQEEEEVEEADENSSESQSSAESDQEQRKRKSKDKKSKKKKKEKKEKRKAEDRSKFESQSESDGAEEEEVAGEEAMEANGATESDEGSGLEMDASPEMSEPPTPPPRLPPYLPALQGCRSVDDFRHLNRIEEGTYGVVFRAEDLKMKEIVALKRLKMEKEKEGFPITSLREINTLLKAQHENIVTVREIVVGSNMDKIYLVMDFVEHDLKALMETMKKPFAIGEVKTLMIQLLKAVAHLHDNWILHRDLKTSNLLLSHKGILKVGDFGLAREYGSPLKPYTPVVVTLWYRAPELLLGAKQYSTAIDMWSCGCIFSELLLMKPLWPGKNEIDELNKIFKDMGTPNEKIWPGVSELPAMKKCNFADYPYNTLKNRFPSGLLDEEGYRLINMLLTYDPSRRISAEQAKRHRYFDIHPLPIDPSMFPTWPARSEQPRGKRDKTPKPPSGGAAYKLMANDDASSGFHLGANNAGGGFNLRF